MCLKKSTLGPHVLRPLEPIFSFPLARTDAAILAQGGGIGPPPLPANCGPSIVPTDYDLPVSCVNGHVYLNGSPVVDATVIISTYEESITAQTADNGSASEQPYFTVSLSNDPFNVQPGEEVTIRAEVEGENKTQTFIAQPGGQQIDVVLAQNRVETAWQGSDEGYLDDTWLWNGEDWLTQSPVTSPSARAQYALTYDEEAGVWLLFGGRNESQYLGETWQYGPIARSGHKAAYDRTRQVVVVAGGRNTNGQLNDMWEWNGHQNFPEGDRHLP